jgi:lysophospholipase L1-like esterase
MSRPSTKRSFPSGMVALLGLGLAGIALWSFTALQPVAVKEIPPTTVVEAVESRGFDGMQRFDLPQTAAAAAEEAAKPPAAVADAGRWEEEIARYEAAAREAPPAAGAVVLLGASNIRMWETLAADFPGLEVVNRGVGGCKLTELAGFAPRLLAAAKPGAVVISAGSNDVHGGADAEAVLAAWRDVIATIRREHPTVPILVMGILPAKSRWEERETQTTANRLIQAAIAAAGGVIDGGPVDYLDVWEDFVGPDGAPDPEAFLDDDLHPSAIGNARRAARMRPVLDRLMAEQR